MAEETPQDNAPTAPKAIFRVPGTAILAVLFLAVCVTPVAFTLPGLQVLYLVPLALGAWVLRTRTTADGDGLTVRTVFGKRVLPWASMKGLSLTEKSKVVAVLGDDTRVALPAVRTRHLPVLSLVSGGRLDDPSGQLADDPGGKRADEE
ncbi:PH domain-containing protein [Amycolatopsis sp. 195334CR]|uniref:PH domain-containing protein n=1 Tax=Amycolatopsis sp. 195334CR TaxID=2814588 RepID=UPI001A900EAB|nr:PH domain-containing protein [Amycolatopsis sp. 195334CR]MBN6033727.1 PH domain-containing protein [Amycolatopsis sp. 195334CR]